MVIRDIKREMPLKYWSFKVAEWIARIGMIGFVCTFLTYFGLGLIMQHSGQNLPESFTEGCAQAIVALIAIALVGFLSEAGCTSIWKKESWISGRATFSDGITRPVAGIPGDLMMFFPEFLVRLEQLPMFHIVGRSNGAELTFQLHINV
ncbi:hypothetical protein [Serratia marcescens]|uniref:hypothetical protein n=1 Tax=Serratia marcescens TaxID=615 RepID=UPI001F16953D|nr:hypothetical protein [Serratia marcescens]